MITINNFQLGLLKSFNRYTATSALAYGDVLEVWDTWLGYAIAQGNVTRNPNGTITITTDAHWHNLMMAIDAALFEREQGREWRPHRLPFAWEILGVPV